MNLLARLLGLFNGAPANVGRKERQAVSASQSAVRELTPIEAFLAMLPAMVPVCGRAVQFARHDNGTLTFQVAQDVDPELLPKWRTDHPTATGDEVRAFLPFYLRTVVGPRVLTLGPRDEVNQARYAAINEALAQWQMLNGPRDKQGRLVTSMHCIGWLANEDTYWGIPGFVWLDWALPATCDGFSEEWQGR